MYEKLIEAVALLLPVVIGALLGFFLKSREVRNESIVRFREEKYAKLLVKLQGFIGLTSSAELKKEFFEEQYQSWLYASDEVIEAINKMINLVKNQQGKDPDPEAGRKAIGNIVVAMRRDLMKSKLCYKSFQYTDIIPNSCKTGKKSLPPLHSDSPRHR